MPRGDWGRPRASKYQRIADYLIAMGGAEVVLTFAEIEVILGDPLSLTAQTSPSWWSGPAQPHTRNWRTLGWHACLEQRNRRVRFTRDDVSDA